MWLDIWTKKERVLRFLSPTTEINNIGTVGDGGHGQWDMVRLAACAQGAQKATRERQSWSAQLCSLTATTAERWGL